MKPPLSQCKLLNQLETVVRSHANVKLTAAGKARQGKLESWRGAEETEVPPFKWKLCRNESSVR